MGKKKDNKNIENTNYEMGEDSTQYGEFIASFHKWLTPDQQRQRVEKLENPGKSKKKSD